MTLYNHANINLMGPCNMRCYYCIGCDVSDRTENTSCLHHKYQWWYNFKYFLSECKAKDVKQIYLTGLNTDPLLYEYLEELVDFLYDSDFCVGIRTNAQRMTRTNWTILNNLTTCKAEAVGLSIPTLSKKTLHKIAGTERMPDWDYILGELEVPYRVSIVVNKFNADEIWDMLTHIVGVANNNLQYIQMCKISSVTRYDEFEEERRLYDEVLADAKRILVKLKEYEGSIVLGYHVVEDKRVIPISWWTKDASTMNALNYFTNGIVSDEYWTIESFLQKQANELL